MAKKTIIFIAEVELADEAPYFDDGFFVPALRDAMYAMMVRGLFDQSFSPSPALKFDPTHDGRVTRYSDGNLDMSELEGFTGVVDDKYEIKVNIVAQTDKIQEEN